MNLSNFLKNKKVKYFLNILLILTVLFSFITVILINTLLNGAVQPEVIIILIASSILLLFNLVLSKFLKNKVLLLIINLVLSITLIGSSIALFVNFKKKLTPLMTLNQLNTFINNSQTDVNSNKINFKIANDNFNTATLQFNDYYQLQIDLSNARNALYNAQNIYNKSNDPALYPKQKQDIQEATQKINDIQKKLNVYELGSSDPAKKLEDNVNSTQLILNNAKLALSTSQENLANYISQRNILNNINIIEGISYSSASMSIISGILSLLTNIIF